MATGRGFGRTGEQQFLAAGNLINTSRNRAISRCSNLAIWDIDWSTLGIDVSQWTGHPDSLIGLDNPLIEGGAISNMQDYGKLLLMQLRGGKCGENRVMSQESVEFIQVDRSGDLTGLFSGFSYGNGLGDFANDTRCNPRYRIYSVLSVGWILNGV